MAFVHNHLEIKCHFNPCTHTRHGLHPPHMTWWLFSFSCTSRIHILHLSEFISLTDDLLPAAPVLSEVFRGQAGSLCVPFVVECFVPLKGWWLKQRGCAQIVLCGQQHKQYGQWQAYRSTRSVWQRRKWQRLSHAGLKQYRPSNTAASYSLHFSDETNTDPPPAHHTHLHPK